MFQHPGGEDVLVEAAGTDATVCFDSIGHSDEAYKLMNDLKIGKLSSKDEVIFFVLNSKICIELIHTL